MNKFILLFILFISITFNLFSENKTALVIGNGNYSHFSILANPIQEARDMKDALSELGFEVILVVDGTEDQIYDAIADFENTLKRKGGLALFHYGGHGVQANGDNYLIPVDANIPDEMRLKSRAIDVSDVIGTMEASMSKTNIIILDACRDNPLPTTVRSSSGRGLARINAPENSIIIYSAEAGETARDGIFTPTLLSYIKTPNMSLHQMMMEVRKDVRNVTNGEQRPGEYSMLEEEIFLVGLKPSTTSTGTTLKSPTISVQDVLYGSIEISVIETGVVYIDGNNMGTISANRSAIISDLTVGTHKLEIHYDNNIESETLIVGKNDTIKVNFTYQKPVQEFLLEEILVDGGSFQMGSTNISELEKPVHTVLVNSFFIGTFEVTQAEYELVMGTNPSQIHGEDHPVVYVSWYDAIEFCNKLSIKEGLTPCYSGSGDNISWYSTANGYRLPTEAEWEFAATGGISSSGHNFSGSNSATDVGWTRVNSSGKSHPVGTKAPNSLGIYDMTGNVWEWCYDRKGDYSSFSQENPTGPSVGKNRIQRGGSWQIGNEYSYIAIRSQSFPNSNGRGLGFRVVRSVEG